MVQGEPRELGATSGKQAAWIQVFSSGLLLWSLSVVVTAVTHNINMIPTVVLLGSFLVPVTAVVWYLDHYRSPVISVRNVLQALIVGGVLGVLAASVLEAWLLSDGVLVYVGVGLLEELAKLAALLVVARGLQRHTMRDGIVLGAAVGFGFAALESSGYAFTSLLVRDGRTVALSLDSLVLTELLRGILAPVGHGLWTAILGGVLFSESRGGSLRLTGKVYATYLAVALLHALWDSMRGIAMVLVALFTATPVQRIALSMGERVVPTEDQVIAFALFQYAGLVVISAIGLVWLIVEWRIGGRAPRQPRAT